ncbi:PilZ domain-containing protein [Exiguobacterium sp. AM39-5BH]|uniref:flagellar brake protein n=1 Tax=Exiguobacterium sp. AM39-5BH TaxID=2292355 RepID=UPI000FE22121|nr:PilZ domain-containing protein [Exiguobacterium sp. AM39-5BH]RHB51077.1 pilus assembly protein PilZ [Exiguobacterium sp. AM39-5BH]
MLKVGQELRVEVEGRKEGKTKIAAINDQIVWIESPSETDTLKTFFLHEEESMRVYFFKGEEQLYAFDTVISKRLSDAQLTLRYAFKLPDEKKIKRVQRREYLRVPEMIQVTVSAEDGHSFPSFETTSLDVSAGGMRIIANRAPVAVDDAIIVSFHIDDERGVPQTFRVKSRLVRIYEQTMKQELSLRFEELPHRDQETILRYCFRAQLEARKRTGSVFSSR